MRAGAWQVQKHAIVTGVARKPSDLRQSQPVTVKRHNGAQVSRLAGNPYLKGTFHDRRWQFYAHLPKRLRQDDGVPQRYAIDHEIGRISARGRIHIRFDRDAAESEPLIEAQVAGVGCRGAYDYSFQPLW